MIKQFYYKTAHFLRSIKLVNALKILYDKPLRGTYGDVFRNFLH